LIAGSLRSPSRSFGEPGLLCQIADAAINESSGLAPSLRYPGQWITHNDSGDGPRFFRFDQTGRVRATVTLKGAGAVDWEGMASARIGGRPYLYFGDIGDNDRRRASVVVYRVEEPAAGVAEVAVFERYEITYPGGPRNSETLMVHPATGDLWIVEKSESGRSNVYRLPAPRGSGAFQVEHVGSIRVGTTVAGSQLTTGGDISPDGRFVVVRTYTAAHEFAAPQTFAAWLEQPPARIPLAVERQGEAIAYAPDGRSLVTTSEGAPCRVSTVAITP
jgi:hypothetical protein